MVRRMFSSTDDSEKIALLLGVKASQMKIKRKKKKKQEKEII